MKQQSTEVDLGNLNTSHSLAILSVSPGSRVLDLAAGDASVARRMKERGCTVWAVAADTVAADAVRQMCDRVLVGDLEGDDVWQALGDERFDVVLALDALAHLRAPTVALRRAARLVAADGTVIVSLPNITHGAIRLSLLEGRFRHQDSGPLRSTPLRFFDRAGAEQLMRDAGLVIGERLRVSRGLHDTEIPVSTTGFAPAVLDTLARDPDAATYQFVFVARPQREPLSVATGATLAERLLDELDALRTRLAEAETQARTLATDRDRLARSQEQRAANDRGQITDLTTATARVEHERNELTAELERRMREAHQRQLEIRHCKADLAVKQAFIDDLREELRTTSRQCETNLRDAREAARALQERGDRLEAEVEGLTIYANSASFRVVEHVIAGLKRIPIVYPAARALVRAIAGGRRRS